MTDMVNVALKSGMARDIEGFPDKTERSVEGALYLTTNYKPITMDELRFIQKQMPDVYNNLYIHSDAGWHGDQAKLGTRLDKDAAGAPIKPTLDRNMDQPAPAPAAAAESTKSTQASPAAVAVPVARRATDKDVRDVALSKD